MYNDIEVRYNDPEEGIVQVILNRPSKLNALRIETFDELRHLFGTELHARLAEVKVVVIKSISEKFFTSGLDLSCPSVRSILSPSEKTVGNQATFVRKTIRHLQEPFISISEFPRPVICCISGICYGLGIDLASACDIRIVSETAALSVREVKIGICADLGTLYFLPRVSGNDSWVREISYTGRVFTPQEAFSNGFSSAPVKDPNEAGIEIARSIASEATLAVEGTKENLNKSSRNRLRESMDYVAVWNSVKLQDTDSIQRALGKAFARNRKSKL